MKIALVHDHLVQEGGAELVLKIFSGLFPEAPIYTLVADMKKFGPQFGYTSLHTSFLQKVPGATKHYQWLLPIMPTATELHDLSQYDVVLSSSSAFSKGVITKSTTLHICYCHTPTRYLWTDTHSYIRELKRSNVIKGVLPYFLTSMRMWDKLAADRVDKFIANSKTVQERIRKYYRRESDIMYPPVELSQFTISEKIGDYFLAGGRLASYKRLDLVVEAFNRLGFKLKIFGEGPEFKKLRKSAKQNIEFMGRVNQEERAVLYSNCIAYIHPQEEDLGITLLEATASGRPVIALAAGGALETLVDGVTGVFFYDQDWAALIDAVIRFKPENYNPQIIQSYAQSYGVERFKNEITQYVDRSWTEWQELQYIRRLRETKIHF